MPLKIAIAVHGRFHAFDMARELIKRGHLVTLFTNYPAHMARRFGIPDDRVYSLISHGLISRVAWRLRETWRTGYPEAWLHTRFGRWAASRICRESWDVVLCWSGIGEETFRALKDTDTLRICQRGSTHIQVQARLLREEAERTGVIQDHPSTWMIEREVREYELADLNLLPSTFVRRTFLDMGIDEDRTAMIPLAVDIQAFRPPLETIQRRCRRIRNGQPLQILNVGTFSFQKGGWDMHAVVKELASERFRFQFVGPVISECEAVVSALRSSATFVPKQPQHTLPDVYSWGDVFWLPTIQDGYAMVLSQAMAAGLPVLTTDHSAGPDLITPEKTGWVLPIRTPEAFIDTLRWCDAHREALAEMANAVYHDFLPRDWSNVAADFETVCLERIAINQ